MRLTYKLAKENWDEQKAGWEQQKGLFEVTKHELNNTICTVGLHIFVKLKIFILHLFLSFEKLLK